MMQIARGDHDVGGKLADDDQGQQQQQQQQ